MCSLAMCTFCICLFMSLFVSLCLSLSPSLYVLFVSLFLSSVLLKQLILYSLIHSLCYPSYEFDSIEELKYIDVMCRQCTCVLMTMYVNTIVNEACV